MEYTAKEIATIIKACRNSSVLEFECGWLKFKLEPKAQVVQTIPFQQTLFDPSQAHNQELTKEVIQNDINEFDEEDHLAQLIASDPVEYEKQKQFGELDA